MLGPGWKFVCLFVSSLEIRSYSAEPGLVPDSWPVSHHSLPSGGIVDVSHATHSLVGNVFERLMFLILCMCLSVWGHVCGQKSSRTGVMHSCQQTNVGTGN